MYHCGDDETGENALCGRYLNNMQSGKDVTNNRILGLLEHSVIDCNVATVKYLVLF